MAFLVAFSWISYRLLHIRERTRSEYSDRMGMCATDTESLKHIFRRCGFFFVWLFCSLCPVDAEGGEDEDVAEEDAEVDDVEVEEEELDDAEEAEEDVEADLDVVVSNLYFNGSCVIWEKLIFGRMISLSMA